MPALVIEDRLPLLQVSIVSYISVYTNVHILGNNWEYENRL